MGYCVTLPLIYLSTDCILHRIWLNEKHLCYIVAFYVEIASLTYILSINISIRIPLMVNRKLFRGVDFILSDVTGPQLDY